MRKIFKAAGLAAACALAAPVAMAQQSAPEAAGKFGFVLGAALEFGGDDVATVQFTNGDEQDVKAGQGGTLDAGVYYRFGGAPVSLRATVGYKYVTTQAENADITLTRVPLQLIGSYHFENGARIGGGLVRHNGIKFDADGLGDGLDFDDATGYALEAGYKWFLLSYTGMDYTDEFGNDYNADNFGVKLIWEF